MRRRRYEGEEEDHDQEDDEENVPLHLIRPFGAGLKRTRVEFVPAEQPDQGIATQGGNKNGISAGDIYAQIVLGVKPTSDASGSSTPAKDDGSKSELEQQSSQGAATQPDADHPTCPVCLLPITTSLRQHEATLAHQVSLAHSHPPSALDRSRMGLRALQSQGWDPDARRGLGREGGGMRFPIKTTRKDNTLGIGATVPKPRVKSEEKPKQLNSKQLRAAQVKEKRRGERLQDEIFGSVDVEKYLRGDGSDQT